MKTLRAKFAKVVKEKDVKLPLKKADPAKMDPGSYYIIDGGTGTFYVSGLDSQTPPQPVDISDIATLEVVSDDPNVVVTSVTGMTAVLNVLPNSGSGVANVTFTASAKDGSWSYSFVAKVSYDVGAITGIEVKQIS